ncbi:NUDIX domain-containing protein [Limosilactobacillus gastricus]|uniref:8-oxo-dGTP diphosphatase n=1 Tax=Limosilactobacillus gastricus DSM 16045 TaxID=1423749 RepID=A0A0R1VE97_9LACO|nr:(deoxy)nucleoside triphosphate pyrophosphohydrolase [Limosilactobacillus gastricus]KRM02459.1 hypothetical protein FC60_GL000279 [Limosilactobacillus gastricus DSM 16045]QGF40053.1 NUDIX domain-containing protein [Limosilactobacillus gastricus]
MKRIKVVGAAIIDDAGHVLISKRKAERVLGSLWEFPGGKIETGETPQAALKREMQEEFQDQIVVGPQVGTTAVHQYDFGEIHLSVYFAKLLTHHFNLLEHSKVEWVEQSELLKRDWPAADGEIVKELAQIDLSEVSFDA